ncbi:MAG: EAL domain-containing protein [Burkholderiaceae bacterium]
MRFRSLESRIITLFLVLILLVQSIGFVLIRSGIETNARTAIAAELAIGERVFSRLLQQNAQNLTQGARLLASDYGFRQAIGTDDRETISSALKNHGERIGAELAMLIGSTGEIKAFSGGAAVWGLRDRAVKLVQEAERTGNANGVGITNDTPYQMVAVPVKAPVVIGWVVMAFSIDHGIADDMRALSSLQVSIFTRTGDGPWKRNLSTLGNDESSTLMQQVTGMTGEGKSTVAELHLSDEDYSTHVLQLAHDADRASVVILQRSISEAVAPYRRLQLTLLILTALGVVVAVAGSAFTARKIAHPLRQLAETAKRLGAGDYGTVLKTDRVDEIGELSVAIESMRTGIAQREEEIGRLAYWDTLTGLPNRTQFAKTLATAIRDAAASQSTFHVLMMDLNRFKYVNDVLGHSFGDALLQQVAVRLQTLVRGSDSIARMGGDEFAVLLPGSALEDARRIASRILALLDTPISLDEQTVDLGAGIGIAGYPVDGDSAETLLSRAEVAMYAAKKTGNEAQVYDTAIDDGSQHNLSLLSELRQAIDGNEFRLYVQPKIMLLTGELVGMEALVRWMHPVRGMVPPDRFIPFAESSGFIRRLTFWMLDRAAAMQCEWQRLGIHLKISVNLSTRDLLDQDLPVRFAEILARHGVPSSAFCLEITESAIMDDPVRAQQTLERLRAMGTELSIDDFGTGYSSLAYLKRLPVQELKIDKSFVLNMAHESDDAAIVRSTIDLGHNMGLRVVAEGIENAAVWNLLENMSCDQGQGYHVSKPMPAEQLAEWVGRWQPTTRAVA